MARRLPVIQSEAPEDAEAAERPPIHWVFIGAGLCVAVWAPLATIATPLGPRLAAYVLGADLFAMFEGTKTLSPGERAVVGALSAAPVLISFFVGALVSGLLVGRFGRRAGLRQAALAGALAALMVSLLALGPGLGLTAPGIFATFGVLSLFGVAGGAIGGLWGRRSRRRAVLDSGPR